MALPKLKLQLRPKALPASKRVQLRDRRPQPIKEATGGELIRDDQLRLEALRLRLPPNNYTYPQIAAAQKCSLSTAHSRVNEMWAEMIDNITECQIMVRSDALQEIEIMKQQLRPYITDPNVTILGADREGNPVVLERWKAMNAAIDRMVKCVELQLKTVGLLGAGQQKPGDDLGQQSLTDAVMRHIAAFIIGNGTEKMANARPV
jgi:hypothetical protein